MFKFLKLLIACLLLGKSALLSAQSTVIHAGSLLASPGSPALEQQSLLISDGKVRDIRPGYIQLPDSDIIDLSCCFVLPGLIDLHVHLSTPVKAGGKLRVVTQNSADLALTAAQFAGITLEAGFTTIVDLGTGHRQHAEAMFALRRATRAHKIPGPRILAVGSPISPTGFSRTPSYRDDVEAVVGPNGVCDGVDECRRAVRKQVKHGADIINFYNTGSLLDEVMLEQTFSDEEMRAIVDTAHALGRRVIADGHSAAGVNAALRAGADIVDTVPWPDKETWRLLKKTGAWFVPHLYAFEASLGDSEESLRSGTTHWLPEPILKRLLSVKDNPYSAVEAHRRGVNIAFGSDTGVIEHGDNAREFTELVRAGLTPMQSIQTATTNAASALGLQDKLGKLEAGYAADLIAVESNPLDDIRQLDKVVFVMRDGRVYKNLDKQNLAREKMKLADAHIHNGELQAAELLYREASTLQPDDAVIRHQYCNLLYRMGQLQDALVQITKASELQPLSPNYHAIRGEILMAMGRSEAALRSYDRATEVAPNDAGAHQVKANHEWSEGRLHKAVNGYRKALTLDAASPVIVPGLAHLYLQLGDENQAWCWGRRASEAQPGEFYTNYVMALLNHHRGNTEKAMAHLQTSLKDRATLNPASLSIVVLRDYLLKLGRHRDALDLYRDFYPELFEDSPPDIVLTNNFAAISLAYLYREMGRKEEAAKLIEASSQYTREASLRGWSGNRIADVLLYTLRGEKTGALQALKRAIDRGWRNQWAYALDHDLALEPLRKDAAFLAMRKHINTDFEQQLKQLEKSQPAEQGCT